MSRLVIPRLFNPAEISPGVRIAMKLLSSQAKFPDMGTITTKRKDGARLQKLLPHSTSSHLGRSHTVTRLAGRGFLGKRIILKPL